MLLISPCQTRLLGRIISASLLASLSFGPFTGCKTGNKDKLETTLRQREKEIALMREDIDRIAGYNLALQSEIRASRGQPMPSSLDPFTPLYPVRSIVVGRTTAPLDEDGKPGDDALQVVLETRDGDGKLFRAPGTVQIHLLEVSQAGLKNPIGSYQFSSEEMRPLWKQGILTSGYVFTLPWQAPPRQDKIRVVASFTMEDGRQFEAEREISIKPPATSLLQVVPDGAGMLPPSGIGFPGVSPGVSVIQPGTSPPATIMMPGNSSSLIPNVGGSSPFMESNSLPVPQILPPTDSKTGPPDSKPTLPKLSFPAALPGAANPKLGPISPPVNAPPPTPRGTMGVPMGTPQRVLGASLMPPRPIPETVASP